jgi:hypothetical protein
MVPHHQPKCDLKAAEFVKLYGKRFTIEETFRETKDVHLGMGLNYAYWRLLAPRPTLAAVGHGTRAVDPAR